MSAVGCFKERLKGGVGARPRKRYLGTVEGVGGHGSSGRNGNRKACKKSAVRITPFRYVLLGVASGTKGWLSKSESKQCIYYSI